MNEQISCGIARDLMPLVIDDACGEDSRLAVEGHIAGCEECAKVYEAIGARVKLSLPGVQKGLFGKEHKIFREEIWKVEDLMALSAQQKQFRGIVLTELQIPKIRLREFAV